MLHIAMRPNNNHACSDINQLVVQRRMLNCRREQKKQKFHVRVEVPPPECAVPGTRKQHNNTITLFFKLQSAYC